MLAIYPLEVYLTKAFEKMPFLTTAYPQSQLAAKTRLVLHELFKDDPKSGLPPQIANLGPVTAFLGKYYMGRWPRVLNLDFCLKAIAVYAILVFGVPALLNSLGSNFDPPYLDVLKVGVLFAVPWVAAVIVLNWTRELDIFLTYSFRTHAILSAAVAAATLCALWLAPAALLGLWFGLTLRSIAVAAAGSAVGLFFFVLAVLAVGLCLGQYARRGIRNIKFDGRYVEGGFRIAFSTIAATLILWGTLFG